MNSNYDIIVIGGGAAGFFAAINCAEKNPTYKIAILERGKEVLSKVKISGGGRCNVAHACFIPSELTKFYPRGKRELLGPFHQFCSGDTLEWFEKKGINLKIEEDGRIFPVTNNSQTIIDCFLKETQKHAIDILKGKSVQDIYQAENYWKIETNTEAFACQKIIISTGSNPKIWQLLKQLGHTIIEPVPSLFTFNCKNNSIKKLMGISVDVSVKIKNTSLKSEGSLLLTHWGFSGPAILRLSAWGARELFQLNYHFEIQINWLKHASFEEVLEKLNQLKKENLKKQIDKYSPFNFPKRLWEFLLVTSNIDLKQKWATISKQQIISLATQLTNSQFSINGKSTFKEEFVTAGGIHLKEVNFKKMESKIFPRMYFAGEVLNIDAITGGFNFQNAWTTAYIISQNI